MRHLTLNLLLALALCGCAPRGCAALKPPPHLVVVRDKAQLATRDHPEGNLGIYRDGTIYLAPGANEDVFWHEWRHHEGAGREIDQ